MSRPLKGKTKPKLAICQKCGKEFEPYYSAIQLCQKCVAKLPRCFACGAVMAIEYGYMECHAKTIKGHKICGSCWVQLRRGKRIKIREREGEVGGPNNRAITVMLPSGEIVTESNAVECQDNL